MNHNREEPKCIHRHTILTHPRCFEKGLIKTSNLYNTNPNKVNTAKILMLDIETSPILALCWGLWDQNISTDAILSDWYVLSWSAKWLFETEIMSDSLTSAESLARNDRRIVAAIWGLINSADIVVSHNGDKFDIKRLNTRFIVNGMPPTKSFKSIDTLKVAREVFSFSSNKLDYINEFLGLPKKDHTGFELWKRCFNGDVDAINELESYNRKDVSILEDLYLRLRPYIKGHPNMNLWSSENVSVCPNCGNKELIWNGHYFTYTGKYEAFRCNNCGAVGRSRVMDLDKEKRATIVR